MKKITYFILLLCCLILVSACSDDANLVVDNDTNHDLDVRIEDKIPTITAGKSHIFTWSLSSSIFGTEEKDVTATIFRPDDHNNSVGKFKTTIEAGTTITRRLSDYVVITTAVLAVRNNTPQATEIRVLTQDYDIPANQTMSFTWELDNVTQRTITGEIYERLFLFGRNFSETIYPGQTTNMTINNDAAGLEINNNSHAFTIVEVYISPSDSPTWGPNQLSGVIGPQSNALWNLTAGTWDILVVDNWDDEFAAFDQVFTIGNLNSYNYTGFRRVENARQMKVDKATGETRNDSRVSFIQ